MTNPLIKRCKSNSRYLFFPTFEVLFIFLAAVLFYSKLHEFDAKHWKLKNIEKIIQNLGNSIPIGKYMSLSNSFMQKSLYSPFEEASTDEIS